ncbi:MAG: helix-turn-helix transcriptional regulator [Thermoanaerobaculia bacterium]
MGRLFDTLVAAIRQAEDRGETRYQLAQRTGVNESTLSRIVNRKVESVSLDTLERLVEALGIRVTLDTPRPKK